MELKWKSRSAFGEVIEIASFTTMAGEQCEAVIHVQSDGTQNVWYAECFQGKGRTRFPGDPCAMYLYRLGPFYGGADGWINARKGVEDYLEGKVCEVGIVDKYREAVFNFPHLHPRIVHGQVLVMAWHKDNKSLTEYYAGPWSTELPKHINIYNAMIYNEERKFRGQICWGCYEAHSAGTWPCHPWLGPEKRENVVVRYV